MANLLSATRGLLSIPFAWLMWRVESAFAVWSVVVLALAIGSDLIDGPLARRAGAGQGTPLGRSLDHGADVCFVLAGLLAASARGAMPILLPLCVALAFAQYTLDSFWLHREGQLRMSRLGRVNGVLYFVPLVVEVAARLPGLDPALAGLLTACVSPIAWLLVASTIVSMLDRLISLERRTSG